MSSGSLPSRVLVVGAAVLACALVAGCTGGDDPESRPTSSPTASTSATPQPVTLRLSVYGDPAMVATYQRLADAYTADHPDIRFALSSTTDAGAAAEASLGAIASGVEAPDIFLLDADHLAAAVEADAVQPLDELLEARDVPFGDGFQRNGLTAFAANDSLACMPNEVSPRVAFYNRRLVRPRQIVRESGKRVESIDTSWTWEVFVEALEQAASRGAKGVYLPPELEEIAPLLRSGGGSIVDSDEAPTRLELSDDDTRNALMTLAGVTRDPRLALTPTDVAQKPAVDWFTEGKLGVLFGTRALLPQLRATQGLRFDVAPLPKLDDAVTTAVMNAYCVSKPSEHVEEAADFITWAVNGGGVEIALGSSAVVPSQLDALHTEAFVQATQLPRNTEAFAEGARRAVLTPYSTHWLAAAASAADPLRRVLYGRIDVTSDETPALDALLEQTDEASKLIFDPPEPTETPTP